jgi:hypothetical protein
MAWVRALRDIGRSAAQLAVALALAMFVATGGAHELLHMDEPASHAAAHLEAASAPAAASIAVKQGAHGHADSPLGGCSAHSASAHAAASPPACLTVAVPRPLRIRLFPGLSPSLDDLATPILLGPPRA